MMTETKTAKTGAERQAAYRLSKRFGLKMHEDGYPARHERLDVLIDDVAMSFLRKMAAHHGISQAKLIEKLIQDEAHEMRKAGNPPEEMPSVTR